MIRTAAPHNYKLGTQDMSQRTVMPEPRQRPTFQPWCMFFGKEGADGRVVQTSAEAQLMYGSETFDSLSKYFNHSTEYMNLYFKSGVANVMAQRLRPDDAKTSNVAIYIDVLEVDVPNYLRNSDGTIAVDGVTPKVDGGTPTIPGIEVKFIAETMDVDAESYIPGALTSKPGTMTKDSITSTMYPLIELPAKYFGENYNNYGFSFIPLLEENQNQDIVEDIKGITYNLKMLERADANSKGMVRPSLYNEPEVLFTFQDKTINPTTNARFDLETVFGTNWANTDATTGLPLKYPKFGTIRVYHDNLDTILKNILSKEKNYVSETPSTWDDGKEAASSEWYDFKDIDMIDDEFAMINFITGKTTKNINYQTYMISTDTPTLTGTQREVNLSTNTPVWLDGGSDGTIDDDTFNTLVERELDKFLDANSEYMDTAINTDSALIDSGFPLTTKYKLFNYIALRKDTNVIVSTRDASLGAKFAPLSDERAIAVALHNKARLMPESTYYGTETIRCAIVGGTGRTDIAVEERVSVAYELCSMIGKFMGAGNGKWKKSEMFDTGKNIFTKLIDVEPKQVPEGIKDALWDSELIWPSPYDPDLHQFQQLQTVYSDDTSVNNNIFIAFAIAECNKIADMTHRRYTGNVALKNAEFLEAVESYYLEQIKDKFAGLFVINPTASITEKDDARGFSWTLTVDIYANNSKTVQTTTIRTFRMTDLEG
jgi:hypothetical protein